MKFTGSFLLVASLASLPGAAFSQEIDKAIQAYNADKYVDAAFLFYDVIQHGDDPEARFKAEYYIAQSLLKAGYYLPAMVYYGDIFNAGPAHPYFLKATDGLLRVAEKIGDDTLIPEVINRGYDQGMQEFRKLKESSQSAINYLVGMISERRKQYDSAKNLLQEVPERSPLHIKAQYILAIMAVKSAREQQSEDYGEALKHFSGIEATLKDQALDDEKKKLLRLTQLGQARAYYSQGDWKKSIEYYEKVPRFSDDWYDAMYESGWAYFRNGDFGRALGMVHAIQSPYFDDRYRAESWVLKATTYFQMCHFDRARKAIDTFFGIYETMQDQLRPWTEGDQTDAEMVDVIASGHAKFPSEVRNLIAANRRYQKFVGAIREVERELKAASTDFPEGSFRTYLTLMLKDQLEQRVTLTGRLVRLQIQRELAGLDSFLNQARIIKFETADAERKMLEAGKDITKGPRARGPRPYVPDSRHQYWAFLGEYWIDELGYYEHSIKNECIPEVFQ